MRRFVPALVILLCAKALAQMPALSSLRAVDALSNAQASQRLPVAFEATVTYYDNVGGTDLFVQDDGRALYVYAKPGLGFVPGDRVLVRGKTHPDFRADVMSSEVRLLHHGTPPEPVAATFGQLIRGELDCLRVRVTGEVRSADVVRAQNESSVYLSLQMEGGPVDAMVIGQDPGMLKHLLDARVEVTGAAAGKFDSKSQLTGIVIEVPSLADARVLSSPATDPQLLPITPMNDVLKSYEVEDRTRRIRVRGSVTYYQPGAALVLENGAQSLWITTQFEGPLRIGQIVDATGFPDARNGYLTLTRGEVRETPLAAPVPAVAADWAQLASGIHAFDLVSVEGKVLAVVRAAAQDEYVLDSGGHLFSAIFRHPDLDAASLPPMKPAEVGSRIRVRGICTLQYGSDPLGAPVAFDVLLRSFDDVDLVATPPWLSVRHLILLLGLLLLVMIAVGTRGWILERRMRRQTAALAARIETEADTERRRSRILENINARRPLTEIFGQIASLVSFILDGAPCWCQIADGGCFGDCPAQTEQKAVVRQDIRSHSGALHGTMFCSVDPASRASAKAPDALSMGAWLTTLAIETRGLYSDLVHRSEFDLLTDVHNRFSLDKYLEALIQEAYQKARIFGLIYIDLDRFKDVNDHYGHLVGDMYLQEAALRMKRQLRPGDVLARLGGDEFGVLVPHVPGRPELEEIALRLEHCFDQPFALEGYRLQGSASVGLAVYPQDGTTRDSLLSAADAAMYVAKHTKRQAQVVQAEDRVL